MKHLQQNMKSFIRLLKLLVFLIVFGFYNQKSKAQCNAFFIDSLLSNGNVHFYSIGSNPGLTYTWNFGDSITGTGINVSHTYAYNGSFIVGLFINGFDSISGLFCKDTMYKTITVSNVGQSCSINPIISYQNSTNGKVNFSAFSSFGAAVAYGWNFGDGSSGASGNNVAHTYATNSTFTVTLFSYIPGTPCGDTTTQTIIITNAGINPCNITPNFSSVNGTSGLVNFSDLSTGVFQNVQYAWYFGDGNVNLGKNVNHTYTFNGNYNVKLLITTYDSTTFTTCYDSIIKVVSVTNANSNPCNMNPVVFSSAGANGNVSFTCSIIPTVAFTTTWNFGDGTGGNGNTTNHTYSINDTFNVSAVIHLLGTTCYDTVFKNVIVSNASGLPCNFNANFTYVLSQNGAVIFNNISTGIPVPSSHLYFWDYGDGFAAYAFSPTHSYFNNGTYTVQLYIFDTLTLCVDTFASIINVSSVQCNAITNFTSINGLAGLVSFTGTVTGIVPTSYQWDFGDNTGNISSANISHTYGINGQFQATLNVTGYDLISGVYCSNSITKTITITNALNVGCTANFFYGPDSSGATIFYSYSSGITPNTTYSWSFGDGTFGSGQSLLHFYSSVGTYPVTLTIVSTDTSSGIICTDTMTLQAIITHTGNSCTANAAFQMVPDSSALLTWTAFPIYTQSTASAAWHWGDGSSTVGFNPSHTYSAPGVYNICLIVTDTCGAMDTACTVSNIFKGTNSAVIYTVNVVPNLTPLSVKKVVKTDLTFNLYPNPNNGEFTISSKSEIQFSVMNELGQIIKTDATNAANNFSTKVSGLNTGVYFIVANSKNATYRKKIVVTK
jgi:PKD repeat protein